MKLNVTCSTDDNYVQHCMAMLCSLFENNKEHEIIVHLLHHGLSTNGQQLIKELVLTHNDDINFYDVDESYFENAKIAEYHPDLSIATYYRLLLPSILDNEIDRILYLDCDVIVLGDIQPLFELNLDGYGVAAIRDCTPCNDAHRQVMGLPLDGKAFCAGVLMINIDYWRKNNCQDNMVKFVNEKGDKLFMEDQDVLNHEFRNCWFQLPYKYGYSPMAIAPLDNNQKWADIIEYVNHPVIIHYASHAKPWLDIRIPDDHYYWEFVKKSGYPNPKEKKCAKRYRKPIRIIKIRYYLNYYIHPLLPDFIEIPLKDFYKYMMYIKNLFNSKSLKEFHLKMWVSKYGK